MNLFVVSQIFSSIRNVRKFRPNLRFAVVLRFAYIFFENLSQFKKMTSLFSSAENDSLERQVVVEKKANRLGDIWTANDLNRCIKFLREGSFSRVCLQFSDEIINYSVEIEKQLKKHIDSDVFLLADTSYGSCCVDEVSWSMRKTRKVSTGSFFIQQIAAGHVQADCIIHFGHACLSKVTRLPVLYVFPKNDVNVDKFIEYFKTNVPDKMEKVFIFYDVGSFHSIGENL